MRKRTRSWPIPSLVIHMQSFLLKIELWKGDQKEEDLQQVNKIHNRVVD